MANDRPLDWTNNDIEDAMKAIRCPVLQTLTPAHGQRVRTML